MKKNFKTVATSLTTLVFLVVGISGVLMYFHLFERSVKDLHEILGLVFVVAALFHVMFNFHSMKNYFTNKIFALSAIVILAVSLAFIIPNSANDAPNPKKVIIISVLNAPIDDVLEILGSSMEKFELQLQKENILLEDESTINQLAKSNQTSPFRIIDIITKKSD